jgi:hypothetical protein
MSACSKDALFANFKPFPIFDASNVESAEVSIFFGEDMLTDAYIARLEQAGFESNGYRWTKGEPVYGAGFSVTDKMIFFELGRSSEPMKTAMNTVLKAFPPFKLEEFGSAKVISLTIDYEGLSDGVLDNYLKELEKAGFKKEGSLGQRLEIEDRMYQFTYFELNNGSFHCMWLVLIGKGLN